MFVTSSDATYTFEIIKTYNMKIYIQILLTLFPMIAFSQQESTEKKAFIELNERAGFYEVNNRYQLLNDTIYHADPGFLINPNYDVKRIGDEDYVVFTYPDYTKNFTQYSGATRVLEVNATESDTNPIHIEILTKTTTDKGKDSANCINGKRLAILKKDFDLLKKTVLYSINFLRNRNYNFSFGILTVPFKLRPKVNDTTNFNITTDITLGPYFGFTKRISKRRRYYLTVPLTAGLSFININTNNTSNVLSKNELGIVPGITWSSGLIVQLEDFNIGFVVGQDFASGVGDRWIYNKQVWFSFAIGYNFLNQK